MDEPTDEEIERRAAELLEGGAMTATGELPPSYITRLVHQLQVHQIELEMQNDELQRARAVEEDAATERERLFDLAPIASAVVTVDGSIVKVNGEACLLFDGDSSALVGRNLAGLIHRRDRKRWRESLEAAVLREAVDRFDVTLAGREVEDADGAMVQLRVAPRSDGETCRVVLIDR